MSLRRLADACARTGDAAGALQHLQGLFSNRQGFALCFKPVNKDAVRDQSVSGWCCQLHAAQHTFACSLHAMVETGSPMCDAQPCHIAGKQPTSSLLCCPCLLIPACCPLLAAPCGHCPAAVLPAALAPAVLPPACRPLLAAPCWQCPGMAPHACCPPALLHDLVFCCVAGGAGDSSRAGPH